MKFPPIRSSRTARRIGVVLLVVGCGGTGPTAVPGIVDSAWSDAGLFEARFASEPTAPRSGDNVVTIRLKDAAGVPVEGATLSVELWMPSMGHGCSCDPVESEVGAGEYRVDKVQFTMPGSWELRVDVDAGDEQDRIVAAVEVR